MRPRSTDPQPGPPCKVDRRANRPLRYSLLAVDGLLVENGAQSMSMKADGMTAGGYQMIRGLLLVGIGLLAASVGAGEPLPGPTAVRRWTGDLLRMEATAKTEEARSEALVTLCDLFVAIRLHPMYDQSEILRGEATRVRRRLLTASRRWSQRLERANVARPAQIASHVDAALAMSPAEISTASLPARSGAAGPGGITTDGWELVELIQRTLHPDFWDNQGGPGSIHYFAIKRVLVVRATTRVHEDLAALLGQL